MVHILKLSLDIVCQRGAFADDGVYNSVYRLSDILAESPYTVPIACENRNVRFNKTVLVRRLLVVT